MAKTQRETGRTKRLAEILAHPDTPVRKQFPILLASDKAIDDEQRTVRFVITTSAVDRDNDTIDPMGWDVSNFMRSPSVLWAHDYSHLPVAKAISLTASAQGLESVAQFPPKGMHPFADTVFDLIKFGALNATSVGFRPTDAEPAPDRDGINFRKQELLEYSIVPVPANPQALIMARSKGVNVGLLERWAKAVLAKDNAPDSSGSLTCPQCHAGNASWDGAFCQACGYCGRPTASAGGGVAKGVSPKDVSMEKADEGASWSAPSLKDLLGDTTWDEATDAQKRKVAGHYAQVDQMPPATFGACHLPHHQASDGKVVWRGVANAAARLNQTNLSGGPGPAKAHLARHYKQFGKTPPWESNATAWAAYEKMSVGQPLSGLVVLLTLGGFADEAASFAKSDADNAFSFCPACGTRLVDDGDADGADMCPACGWQADPMAADDDHGGSTNELRAYEDGDMSCSACGGMMQNGVCQTCGSQMTDPMSHPVQIPDESVAAYAGIRAKMAQTLAGPAYASKGWSVVRHVDDDPVRWNRSLSKAFDVAGEPMEPCRTEVAWVSRYLETPVQELSVESLFVPSARMGSFLSAYDESLTAWHVDALRSMTESGRESPPGYEGIQLNSTTARSFMVEGARFMRRADGAKLVGKIERHWSGLYVTHYVRHEHAEVRRAFVDGVTARSSQINFLKGEAFTLSGEFLDRGNLDWPDLFLEPAKEAVLRRTVDRINGLGGDMESRGLMEMGPPGTGKTLSGRVMMRQAPDATFIWVSARDFYRSGAFGAFTYAFDLAAECAPSIIFFEDVDNWISSTEVDLLKTEMDGLKRRKGIQTILTTNFPELIPDALIDRPGRFHDLLELSLPTEAVRARMLRAWLPEAGEAASAQMAKDTDGFSGAHLRELVNFARTIQGEETLSADAALSKALAKLREQRELVAALRRGPDYRPGRQARMAVGSAMQLVAKRGRVLSAANEQRIRQAKDHLDAVLDKLNQQPPAQEPGDGNGDEKVLLLADDAPAERSVVVFNVEDEKDSIVVRIVDEREAMATPEEVRAAVDAALRSVLDGLGPLVREQTTVALARARGRVD